MNRCVTSVFARWCLEALTDKPGAPHHTIPLPAPFLLDFGVVSSSS